jgi:hypothetical protein
MKTITAACVISMCFAMSAPLYAQAPPPPTAQKEAMAKLAYWVGEWKGKGTVVLGPGEERQTEVTESIAGKLDGLVLYIEGVGKTKNAAGVDVVTHNAIGIVWYDPAAKQYRMKSFVMQGFTTETELKPVGDGFEWGFKAGESGPTMRYTITNRNGKWREVGEMSTDSKTWRKFFEMNLVKQSPVK